MAVIEGTVKCVRHENGRVEILTAPPTVRIALAMLNDRDPVTIKASGDHVTFGGQVVYRITGWDSTWHALLAELVEDRRA